MAGIGKKAQAKAATAEQPKKAVKTATPPKATPAPKRANVTDVAAKLVAKAAQNLTMEEVALDEKPPHTTAARSVKAQDLAPVKGSEETSLAARLAKLRTAPPTSTETLSARMLGSTAVQSENRGMSRRDALKARLMK